MSGQKIDGWQSWQAYLAARREENRRVMRRGGNTTGRETKPAVKRE